MAAGPTERTLKAFANLGRPAWKAEYWNAHAGRRVDLFGFIDVVALLGPTGGVCGVQCTTVKNASARVKKITTQRDAYARAWIESGGRIEVWGWARRRRRKVVWCANRTLLRLDADGAWEAVPLAPYNPLDVTDQRKRERRERAAPTIPGLLPPDAA